MVPSYVTAMCDQVFAGSCAVPAAERMLPPIEASPVGRFAFVLAYMP